MTVRAPDVAPLEPALTGFDRRVLATLDRDEFRDAWDVARRVGEYDAGLVRDTLRGLAWFGYAHSTRFDKAQAWVSTGRAPGADPDTDEPAGPIPGQETMT